SGVGGAVALLAVGAAVGSAGGFSGMDSGALEAARMATASGDLLKFVNLMDSPDHTIEQEDESDAIGFDLTNLTPYAAETASARVFDTIQADADNRAKLSEQLGAQMKKQLEGAVKDGSAVSTVMTGVSGGDIRGSLFRGAARVGLGMAANRGEGPKHRTPEARKKGIADYSVAAYPDGLPLRDEQKTWLDEVRGTREYADARVTVQAVKAAMILRASGKYAEAEAELSKANATSFRASPLVLNAAARVRGDMGDPDRSDQLFKQAHQSPDQTVDGYVDHVRMLYQAGRADPAVAMVDEGSARFGGDDKPFLALLIGIYKQAGMSSEQAQYFNRCVSYKDPGLSKDCEVANGGAGSSQASAPRPGLPGLGGLGGLIGR
ncbi:MAG TPA: hypothetical protein VIO94_05510, partial [Phenylobacterium sp.]